MNRREFSMLVGGAAARWAQRASAQQQKAAPGNPAPRLDWLARHKEPILEPGLPIIDPHHHLWQRPGWRYLLDDLLTDTGSGHNIVATVYMEASSMYREGGPEEMRPVGEVEFANGVAAMCGSGVFGKTRVAAGIVGHADMMLGSRVEPVLNALMRAGGDRFRGIRHGVSWEALPPLDRIQVPTRGCWPTRSSGKASRWSAVLAFPTMCRSIIPRSAKSPIWQVRYPIPESSSIMSAAFSG